MTIYLYADNASSSPAESIATAAHQSPRSCVLIVLITASLASGIFLQPA